MEHAHTSELVDMQVGIYKILRAVSVKEGSAYGGFGFTSRMWGLTLDNIASVDLVLANGSLVKTSAHEHPDLFWVRLVLSLQAMLSHPSCRLYAALAAPLELPLLSSLTHILLHPQGPFSRIHGSSMSRMPHKPWRTFKISYNRTYRPNSALCCFSSQDRPEATSSSA